MDTFFLEVINEEIQNTVNTLFWIYYDIEYASVEKKVIYPDKYKIKLNVILNSFQYIQGKIENEISKNKNIDISRCNTLEEELKEFEKISKKGI